MADRRKRVKQGLGAVLRRTTEQAEEPEEAPEAAEAEEQQRTPRTHVKLSEAGRERTEQVDTEKRHTSVYLYPTEFDLLDDMIYLLRREHGVRIPKTELWRALLHMANRLLEDPERVDELLEACGVVLEE